MAAVQIMFLKDNPDVIRLFFYAPLEDCIRRVVDQNGISAKEAEKKIAKIDKYRADYYKYYTGNAWNDARNYDFCLDTSSMSYEKLVAVVKDIIKIYRGSKWSFTYELPPAGGGCGF